MTWPTRRAQAKGICMQITREQLSKIDDIRFEMSEAYTTLKFLTEACNAMVDYPNEVDLKEMFGGLFSILDNVTHELNHYALKVHRFFIGLKVHYSSVKFF